MSGHAFGQAVYTLTDSNFAYVNEFALLVDNGYSFERVLNDKSLHFSKNDSIRPWIADTYWIKVAVRNPSRYSADYYFWAQLFLNNVLFYQDPYSKTWIASRGGSLVTTNAAYPNDRSIRATLAGGTTSLVFIKVDVSRLKNQRVAFHPKLRITRRIFSDHKNDLLWNAWIASISVLVLFFLNNLYIYWSFRDKTVLYYLIAQLGGIFYITTYRSLSVIFINPKVFTMCVEPNGFISDYDVNALLMHIAVCMVLYGLIQFTRSYLVTKKTFPKLDRVMRSGVLIYLVISVLLMVINTNWVYLEFKTLLYDNIFVMFLIGLMIVACIVGYQRKLPASGPFLIANILPLFFMLGITLFHVFIDFNGRSNTILPDLAIVSQALAFSIALVARTKSIQNNLKIKELEAQKLEFDLKEIELSQRLIEMENEKIHNEILNEKTRNELLQQRLEANQRELASTTMYIVQKNELLVGLKSEISDLSRQYPKSKQGDLKGIKSILQSNLYLDGDWRKFRVHFEQVHPHFFEDLEAKYPSLTKNEMRLYAYFHINLSTKEIAAMLNIDPASVRRAKTRLFKKISIPENGDLIENED